MSLLGDRFFGIGVPPLRGALSGNEQVFLLPFENGRPCPNMATATIEQILKGAGGKVTVSDTAPANPAVGDIWGDSFWWRLNFWDGTAWRYGIFSDIANMSANSGRITLGIYNWRQGFTQRVDLSTWVSSPTPPVPGTADDTVASGGQGTLWWDGTKLSFSNGPVGPSNVWREIGDGRFLPLTGGALTGGLTQSYTQSGTTGGIQALWNGLNLVNDYYTIFRLESHYGGGIQAYADGNLIYDINTADTPGVVLWNVGPSNLAAIQINTNTGGVIIPSLRVFGVTDGSDAQPGTVGEVISQQFQVSSPVTGSWQALGTLNLTAGDWDVVGNTITNGDFSLIQFARNSLSISEGTARGIPGIPQTGMTDAIAPFRVNSNAASSIDFSYFATGTSVGTITMEVYARRAR